MVAGGYFGQALDVDAGAGTGQALPLADDLLRAYAGGAGLGGCTTKEMGRRIRYPPRFAQRRLTACSV